MLCRSFLSLACSIIRFEILYSGQPAHKAKFFITTTLFLRPCGAHTIMSFDATSESTSSQPTPSNDIPSQQNTVYSWAEVADLIGKNFAQRHHPEFSVPNAYDIPETQRLSLIQRRPSERQIYKAWCSVIIARYGSLTSYLCKQRLGWLLLPGSSAEAGPVLAVQNQTPFADARDFQIQRNDWPYGAFGKEITHLVVWLKPRVAVEPETGLMTEESKALAQDYVDKTFVDRLRVEEGSKGDAVSRVLWFKNPASLQSVKDLEHIHVLVRDVPDEVVAEWVDENR